MNSNVEKVAQQAIVEPAQGVLAYWASNPRGAFNAKQPSDDLGVAQSIKLGDTALQASFDEVYDPSGDKKSGIAGVFLRFTARMDSNYVLLDFLIPEDSVDTIHQFVLSPDKATKRTMTVSGVEFSEKIKGSDGNAKVVKTIDVKSDLVLTFDLSNLFKPTRYYETGTYSFSVRGELSKKIDANTQFMDQLNQTIQIGGSNLQSG